MLKLYLLGTPRIELDGKPLSIRRRKSLALLLYLAVSGEPHSRDALATLFYPDLNQQRARSYFRRDLGALNTHLKGEWLSASRESVGLNQSAEVWLDIAEFRSNLLIYSKHPDPSEDIGLDRLSLLTMAADLYTGHFLDGFSLKDCPEFDDWQFFEAENLRQELVRVLEHLITVHIVQKQYAQGLPYARRLLTLDPFYEPAQRHLMKLYALVGQEAAALRQYEICVTLFEEEFGSPPEKETRRLYQAIKARRLEQFLKQTEESQPDASLPRSSASQPATVQPPAPTIPSLPAFMEDTASPVADHTDFVGREQALSHLAVALDSARSGQGQTLFVIGGAGRGKTMLVQEFARQSQSQDNDLIVINGYCDAITGIGDPYLPFREALTMLTGEVEAQWAGGMISQRHARQLWDLIPITLPVLVQHAPDLIGSFVPGQALLERATLAVDNELWIKQLETIIEDQQRTGLDQTRIFAQYAAVLKAIAAHRPILLIVEDLHWADTASSSLLFHLSRAVAGSSILVIGTYRPEEVGLSRLSSTSGGYLEQHPLANIISELKRQHGDVWLDLDDMTSGEGRQFVDAYLDTQPNQLSTAFREAVFQWTEGHALFTVELIRAMQARGELQQNETGQWFESQDIDWTTLPVKVGGVIESRVQRLTEDLQVILTIASVEGETFTAEVVAHVQHLDQRMLISQLSRELDKRHHLVTAQAVERPDTSRSRLSLYRFRHNLFQHYFYKSLDEAERGYLHEAVGHALEQLYAGRIEGVAGRLARHFEIAGLIPKAIDYLQQAGDGAAAVYANVEAAAYYTRALELINSNEAASETVTTLYTRLGRALELNSQFDEALATYKEMEKLAHQQNDIPMTLAALMAQMTLHANWNPVRDIVQAESLAEETLTLARDLGDQTAEVRILWLLVNVYGFSDRVSQAIDSGERALALARGLTLQEQIAKILLDVGRICMLFCRFEQAKMLLDEAVTLWRSLNNLPLLADSLSTVARLNLYLAEYDQALEASEEAFQINLSTDNLWGQAHSRQNAGYALWDRGHVKQAITAMEDAIRLGELAGFKAPQVFSRTDLATVYADLGAIERGLETIQLTFTLTGIQTMKIYHYALAGLAQIHLRDGNLTAAEVAVNQAKAVTDRESFSVYSVPAILIEGELLLRQGDYETAVAVLDNLLDILRQFGMRVYLPTALYLQGQALLALGQVEIGRKHLEEARIEAEAIGSRRMMWQILAALAQIEADPAEAGRLRQQAREIVEFIADHTPADLRDSFLDLPGVVAIT